MPLTPQDINNLAFTLSFAIYERGGIGSGKIDWTNAGTTEINSAIAPVLNAWNRKHSSVAA